MLTGGVRKVVTTGSGGNKSFIISSSSNSEGATAVHAVNDEGGEVDNWTLLEGDGRGNNESSSFQPTAFWRQVEGGRGGSSLNNEQNGRSIKLKRTYSTYSSLVL